MAAGEGQEVGADAGSANKSRPWRSIVFSPLGDGQRRRRGSDALRVGAALVVVVLSLVIGAANSHLELSISNALHPPPNGVKWLVTTVDSQGPSAPLRCWRSWPFSPGDGASPATWCSPRPSHSCSVWPFSCCLGPGRAPVESLAQRPWARGPGGSHRHRHRRRLRGPPVPLALVASSRRAGDRHLGRRSAGPW